VSKNNKHNSLQRLITSAFIRLTAIVSISFAVAMYSSITFIENKLIMPHLQHDLEQHIQSTADKQGVIIEKFRDMVFYRVDVDKLASLPDYIKNLDTGFHEVSAGDKAFHILLQQDGQYQYVLEINQSQFEHMEYIIFGIIMLAMFISWILAVFSARVLSKKILQPVQVLAEKIRELDEQKTTKRNFADDFADDEIGKLAHYFEQYNRKIQDFLLRERLFTSDVSHELRTPLMVISSTCELLLAQQDESSKDYVLLQKIKSACNEMKSLITIFMTLARDNAVDSNQKLEKAEIILQKQYQHWLPIAQDKGLSLHYKVNDKPPGQYPEQYLNIITSNLIRNAIHYTLQGEIQLILDIDGFSIIDSGIGIPEIIQNSIFEPFVRAQNTATSGLGLGLSIVKRICERQGWKVSLESNKKHGTWVTVHF
jgi:signal transduction histidine kinase